MGRVNRRTQRERLLAGAVAFVMFCATISAGAILEKSEVYAHWADSFLNKLAAQNIMRGDEKGNFNPDKNITRAEFAAMLNRAFGFERQGGTSFTDVAKESWYVDDLSYATYQGYFQGTGNGLANPTGNLTRQEAVTMLCRALKIESIPIDTLKFADSRNFASWSKGYINATVEKGTLSGYPDNTFRPQNNITRGEVAKMLSVAAGEIINQPTQAYLGYVDGNVTLSKSGAGLRNTVITGDLYITEGVQSGYVFLDNVTVLGSIIISGAGESNTGKSSVVLTDCDVNNIVVDVGHNLTMSLLAQGNSIIRNTIIKSNTFLEESNTKKSAFEDVQLKGPSGTALGLSGDFKEVRVMASGNILNLNMGNIEKLTIDEAGATAKVFLEKKTSLGELYIDGAVDVTGTGTISYLEVGANGGKVAQVPDEIIIRPGVTATVGGKQMGYLDAEMENASPRIVSGYPEIKEITVNSASGQVMVNKPGTLYWVVKDAVNTAEPSEEDMLDPKNAKNLVSSGNMSVDLAAVEDEIAAKLSGMKNGGEYDLYVMLVDAKGNSSAIRNEGFETLDKIAPKFIAGYPKGKAVSLVTDAETTPAAISAAAIHSLEFEAVPTKDCTLHWAVVPEKSTAPTSENFFAGKIAGALKKGTLAVQENEISTFSASGLAEDTPYDIYIGLKDSKGNESAVTKMTLRTKDITPPEFTLGNPVVGVAADKAIEIQFMTNESATLYWAILARGSKFPPGAPADGVATSGGAIVSYWSTDAAKQAVVTGNNAFKSGNTKTTIDKPGSFNITGLNAETAYDLYLVLVDASGNRSNVGKMEVVTKSNVPPTAKMVFDEILISPEGNPPVGSEIKIVFSKPVMGALGDTAVVFTKVPKDKLGGYIQLYNTSKQPRVAVPINFEHVNVTEESGYTTVTFPTTATNATSEAAIKVDSGGKYVFELKGIIDLSSIPMQVNAPDSATRLTEFQMQAPFVNLRNVATTERTYDVLFEVEPKIKDAVDTLFYDNVFETSKKITFDLYEIGKSDAIAKNLTIEPNKYYTMQYLIENTLQCTYKAFNALTKTQYGFKITAIEGNTDAKSWNGSVTVSVRGTAGTLDGMTALAANGQYGNFTNFMKTADEVTVVSDPGQLSCIKYFEDMVPPEFLNMTVSPGDSTVQISVTMDKPATIYYLVAPRSSVNTVPPMTQDQLINGTYKTTGSVWGKFEVPNGNAVVSEYVRGLVANTEYYIFYLARGTRASEIKYDDFETVTVYKPVFAPGYPQKTGQGEKSAYVRTQFREANAETYWAAYPVGAWVGETPLPAIISGTQTSPGRAAVDSGSKILDEGEIWDITVRNLVEGQYYDFFIVAKNPLSADGWTQVEKLTQLTARDMQAPGILSSNTTITYKSDQAFPTYSGVLTVTFTKPLYYAVSEQGEFEALTHDTVKDNLKNAVATLSNISTTVQSGNAYSSPINSIQLTFKGAPGGDTITFPYIIGDGANRAGYLVMTFVTNKTDPELSYWDVQFKDRSY